MNISKFCCEKCPLKFDKKIILEMHLNVVHKERNEIKVQSTFSENLTDLDTNLPFKCKVSNLELDSKPNLDQHNTTYHKEISKSIKF